MDWPLIFWVKPSFLKKKEKSNNSESPPRMAVVAKGNGSSCISRSVEIAVQMKLGR